MERVNKISEAVVRRLSLYLRVLRELSNDKTIYFLSGNGGKDRYQFGLSPQRFGLVR
jgi:hypothetical protein